MSAVLRAVIDHHIWANDTLFAFCQTLTAEQLQWTGSGTYGQLHKTLAHIAEAEQIYLSRIPDTGIERVLDDDATPLPPVSELRASLQRSGEAWRAVIARWPDDHPIHYRRRDGREEHRSISFSVVQMLDHGAEHRNHIRTILSSHGIEPPEIDGWAWDEERTETGDDG
ncbi:MAG TPA: DinB family protein [Thermomicrobiales bacterium]|nr:DinB family protein [Thermomicrobiales bacterium]